MEKSKMLNDADVVFELKKQPNKLVLLFRDNLTMKRFTERLYDLLHSDVEIANGVNASNPIKIMQNMIQFGEATIFLGLRKDETMLYTCYEEKIIRYYSEGILEDTYAER